MATVREIAEQAGVGVGTASRALKGSGYVSEGKKQRILAAAERLGYVPREAAVRRQSGGTVGVVLPDVSLPFYGNYLKYVQLELENAGYRTMICNNSKIITNRLKKMPPCSGCPARNARRKIRVFHRRMKSSRLPCQSYSAAPGL